MAERLKARDSKSRVRVSVPRVRIPVSPLPLGEVTEWLKVHDWNSCVGQLTGGSNPPLSAISTSRRLDPVLIGPPNAGKTTVSAMLAQSLGVEHHELDRLRLGYTEIGFDMDFNLRLNREQGFASMLAYWRVFAPHSIERFLGECHGVLDTGGGSPVADHPTLFGRIQTAFAPFDNVVLLLPDPDLDRSMEILGERSEDSEPLRVNQRHFMENPSFRTLATHVVYTGRRSAQEVHDDVLARIR